MKSPRGIAFVFLVTVALGMLAYPAEALHSARQALELWANIVLPATFPFLVLAELSIAWEVPQALAVLSAPFVRSVFHLPGTAAFPLLLGIFSGYPTTAKISARLVQEGLLDRTSAARLTGFLTSADPLFLSAAVATGILGRPELAPYLLTLHYGTALALGVCSRFIPQIHHTCAETSLPLRPKETLNSSPHAHFREAPGRILARAVHETAHTLIAIGGIMTFFSVVIRVAGLGLSWCASKISEKIAGGVLGGILTGFVEITLGLAELARTPIPENIRISLVLFLLGWGGLSVHAQIAAFLAEAGVSFRSFPIYRFLHGTISAALSLFIWPYSEKILPSCTTVITSFPTTTPGQNEAFQANLWPSSLVITTLLAVLLILVRVNTPFPPRSPQHRPPFTFHTYFPFGQPVRSQETVPPKKNPIRRKNSDKKLFK